MTFEQLGVMPPILQALATEGYTTPTPIQEASIPIVLKKHDLLGCAQTGTGKTAAFAIPILQLLETEPTYKSTGPRDIRTLILTPTRELAIQIGESFEAYGRHLKLRHTVIFGGVSQHSQVQALQRGVDILIATPGRLLDLISQKFVHLHHLKLFVLDEADRMLDMGFIHDVRKVITKIPERRQTLFFSATMPPEIQQLANTILVKPEKVEVTPVSSTAETIDQTLYFTTKNDKRKLLLHLLDNGLVKNALVFTRTKHGADRVAKDLVRAGVHAEAIHGNKSQNARQRALSNFKSGDTRILVATDIAARGIDVEGLSHVINYEIPNIPETYVHRIGRTGRAGAAGEAISMCDEEELEFVRDIQKLTGIKIPVVTDHPYAADLQVPERPMPQQKKKPTVNGGGGNRPQRNAGGNSGNAASGSGARQGGKPNWRNRSKSRGGSAVGGNGNNNKASSGNA